MNDEVAELNYTVLHVQLLYTMNKLLKARVDYQLSFCHGTESIELPNQLQLQTVQTVHAT